jgi:hypothetical protein
METVRLGLVVSPAVRDAAGELEHDLEATLRARFPEVDWDVDVVDERLVVPPARLTELVDAARTRLLEKQWDLAIVVTELPLRLGRRPLVAHASPTHGIALLSLPALGVLHRRRRLRDGAAEAVAALVGDSSTRLTQLASDTDEDLAGAAFLTRVISGNLGLLLGMIRANQPWRLIPRLSRALLGAIATAAFAIVSPDLWHVAAAVDAWRLAVLMLIAVGSATLALIAVHGLWEHARDRTVREQVALFNIATLATVGFGVCWLYAAVFAASLLGAALVIDASLLPGAGFWDYARLAWFASSLATLGGALGATLETDAAVREAAYAYRP